MHVRPTKTYCPYNNSNGSCQWSINYSDWFVHCVHDCLSITCSCYTEVDVLEKWPAQSWWSECDKITIQTNPKEYFIHKIQITWSAISSALFINALRSVIFSKYVQTHRLQSTYNNMDFKAEVRRDELWFDHANIYTPYKDSMFALIKSIQHNNNINCTLKKIEIYILKL